MLGQNSEESDAVTICNLVLNTLKGHFNDHKVNLLLANQLFLVA